MTTDTEAGRTRSNGQSKGPEWAFFGEPIYVESPQLISTKATIPSLLKRQKNIPLVECAFCASRVPARSNSLRRHLRECPNCSDEARQFCVKQAGDTTLPMKKTKTSPTQDQMPLERTLKATQRRLKNRLACRENRKKKKQLRENIKGEVSTLCTNNSAMHKEINKLLGFDESTMECMVVHGLVKLENTSTPMIETMHHDPMFKTRDDIKYKAALFFARYKPGDAVPRHDTPEGSFYSAQTCQVIGDPATFSTQLTIPGPLEAIWDMKSLLINDMVVLEPDMPIEKENGDIDITLIERGKIRNVRLLHRLFNAATVAQIEKKGGAADTVGEFTWRIVCTCNEVRVVAMRIKLVHFQRM
ncbi:hypothetical protein THRCLA_02679 [Thraustotheca clavata]|uniref:BZIP domain-containing protein n=1 Tax=Thraustotheca clavata TaxID=74557 RepID=A0A1W0A4M6_9STRA|nr:hypothetical protein THRCLA_02679 [Thraustotheca clavata]